MPQALADRVALVTGASRGIGYAAALALARAGAHVVAVARTVGGLEELDDAISAAGGSATLVPLDMRDYDGLYRLAAGLNERHARLDVLLGNAGAAAVPSPLGHIEPKTWDEVMAVNVTANWHLIRAMGEKGRDPVRPQFTDHCFTGEYPTPLTDQAGHQAPPRQLSLLAEAG